MFFEFLYNKFPISKIKNGLNKIWQVFCPHMLFKSFWSPSIYGDDIKPYFKKCNVCGREKEIVNNIFPLKWK